MGKYKAPKPKKSKAAQNIRGALPCALLMLMIFGLLMFLFYAVLKSGT
jgi:hypothetical protein